MKPRDKDRLGENDMSAWRTGGRRDLAGSRRCQATVLINGKKRRCATVAKTDDVYCPNHALWVPPKKGFDPECKALCIALNRLPGIETTECCCGHGKYRCFATGSGWAARAVLV